jgi:diaminopimelate epimerase
MRVPFCKAHGAGNDFLLTWQRDIPSMDLPSCARAICSRRTGVGADGWYLVDPDISSHDAALRLFNSDGSSAELSGNGTRCAAAFLIDAGLAAGELCLLTGAGEKKLRLLQRSGLSFLFEMEVGRPAYLESEIRLRLPLTRGPVEATILNVGNPQCAVFIAGFPPAWQEIAAEIESHPRFPNRTNVSMVRVVDEHTLEARFFERGAGETLSSGTGSAGAAVAAILRGLAASPVQVRTAAGPLEVRWAPGGSILQVGPAEIVARGEYYL